jgi:copper transport protein
MRFSTIAGFAVLAILATGIAQSIVHVENFGNLLDTAFGRAVLIKIGLFGVIVALGWVNRKRLLPQLSAPSANDAAPGRAGIALRRTLRVELVLGAAVIAVTAALASYQPSSTVAAGPFSTDFTVGPARAEVTVDPADVGANEIHLYLFDRRTGAQYDETKELSVRASLPEKDIAPIDLDPRKAGPGHYVVTRAALGVRGDWQIDVSARVSRFDQHDGSFAVPIE